MSEVIGELNPVLRGFAQHFRVANCKGELRKAMGWVRRRLRCIQLKMSNDWLHGEMKLIDLAKFDVGMTVPLPE